MTILVSLKSCLPQNLATENIRVNQRNKTYEVPSKDQVGGPFRGSAYPITLNVIANSFKDLMGSEILGKQMHYSPARPWNHFPAKHLHICSLTSSVLGPVRPPLMSSLVFTEYMQNTLQSVCFNKNYYLLLTFIRNRPTSSVPVKGTQRSINNI